MFPIRKRIRKFLGLPDPHPDPLATSPHPDPLVTSTDPAPDQAKIARNTLIFYCFVTLKNDVNVPVFRIRILRIRKFLGLPIRIR